jgi:peptidoglycan/LPS O-acetylase OafA/YrhL
LRLLWSGSEAVIIFFVLSGFVLALPYARSGELPTRYFYPRRMIRLYLPAIASLLFAYVIAQLVPRDHLSGASAWVDMHSTLPNGLRQVILGSSLMYGWGGLNLSLWSLRWEVLFSLLLVVFILYARLWPQGLWIKVILVVVVCGVWPPLEIFYGNAVYITVFALGVLMAFSLEKSARIAKSIPAWGWAAVTCGAAVLLTYAGLLVGVGARPLARLMSMWMGFAALGALLMIFAAVYWQPLVDLLTSPPVRWLGQDIVQSLSSPGSRRGGARPADRRHTSRSADGYDRRCDERWHRLAFLPRGGASVASALTLFSEGAGGVAGGAASDPTTS